METLEKCTKNGFKLKWKAKIALAKMLKSSSKKPWRDEISIYQCDICNNYHISSKMDEYVPTSIRDKSYFEIQKEKWGKWLHNHSQNGAVINKQNKKYST